MKIKAVCILTVEMEVKEDWYGGREFTPEMVKEVEKNNAKKDWHSFFEDSEPDITITVIDDEPYNALLCGE